MKIAVVGLGYVGLSNAVLLAQNHDVTAVDVSAARVDLVNNRKSPIVDAELEDFLAHKSLQLTATTDLAAAARDAELVVIATPTDYDPHTNHFDTSSVENVARAVLARSGNGVTCPATSEGSTVSALPSAFQRKVLGAQASSLPFSR